MAFLALVDAPLSSESMKFPVFSLLAGNLGSQETGSLETASSSGESRANQVDEAAVLDGVDAKEIMVVGGTDEAFELREDIRRPASCRSERAEALAQEALIDRRRDTHLMHPT